MTMARSAHFTPTQHGIRRLFASVGGPVRSPAGQNVGDVVRIRRGICGAGFRFTVTRVVRASDGVQLYGHNYGPVRASEVEVAS
jgi:hypothetical protein